eukprot:768530-Hanusia_phi.AAC.2
METCAGSCEAQRMSVRGEERYGRNRSGITREEGGRTSGEVQGLEDRLGESEVEWQEGRVELQEEVEGVDKEAMGSDRKQDRATLRMRTKSSTVRVIPGQASCPLAAVMFSSTCEYHRRADR